MAPAANWQSYRCGEPAKTCSTIRLPGPSDTAGAHNTPLHVLQSQLPRRVPPGPTVPVPDRMPRYPGVRTARQAQARVPALRRHRKPGSGGCFRCVWWHLAAAGGTPPPGQVLHQGDGEQASLESGNRIASPRFFRASNSCLAGFGNVQGGNICVRVHSGWWRQKESSWKACSEGLSNLRAQRKVSTAVIRVDGYQS